MSTYPEWEVKLAISGAVTLRKSLRLDVEKGSRHSSISPFQTVVRLSSVRNGLEAEVIIRASSGKLANDSAVYFFGQMLDVLCLRLNTPLYLSLYAPEFRQLDTHVKRVVERDEWMDSFRRGREYSQQRTHFSRALSWYRKSLNSEDSIDKLMGLWSAIEGIGAKYYHRNERTRQGIINQICDCFDQLWGDCSRWKVIPNDSQMVNKFDEYRNGIVHGFMQIDIDKLREISDKLPIFQELTLTFLCDWEQHRNGNESDGTS